MTLILVALGAFCLGSGITGYMAHHFLHIGFQLGRDDRALDPGPVVGTLSAPSRPVGEASGKHHKPQASDGPPPVEDDEWPYVYADKTEVLEPVRDEVQA